MRALLPISLVASAAYLALIVFHHASGTPLSILLKVGSIGLLVLFAATVEPGRKLLVAALACSALGDFFLEAKHLGLLGPVRLFLLGLVSFLVAHLFYVLLFVKANATVRINAERRLASLIVVVLAIVMLTALWPGLAEMRWPVAAYSVVLTAMAVTAQFSRFSRLVAIGALSFFASDTMLALSIFGRPFAGSRLLVWITYYAAQLMITLGVTETCKQKQVSA
jgi:uncharacterized membrane protein YhhN